MCGFIIYKMISFCKGYFFKYLVDMYMHINFFFIFAQNLGSNLSARSSRLVKSRYTTLIHHVSSLTTTPLKRSAIYQPKMGQ